MLESLFQSLFSWNLLLDAGFLGPARLLPGEFQSLFSWNLLLDKTLEAGGGQGLVEFQSLFSWNLLLDFFPSKAAITFLTFQSLFSWNLLLDHPISLLSLFLVHVSILVFVELALGLLNILNLARKLKLCFNPCFRGTCSWTSGGLLWQ